MRIIYTGKKNTRALFTNTLKNSYIYLCLIGHSRRNVSTAKNYSPFWYKYIGLPVVASTTLNLLMVNYRRLGQHLKNLLVLLGSSILLGPILLGPMLFQASLFLGLHFAQSLISLGSYFTWGFILLGAPYFANDSIIVWVLQDFEAKISLVSV